MRQLLKAMITRTSVGRLLGQVPYVQDAYRRRVWPRQMNALMGTYGSYEEAAEAAARISMAGWDEPALARLVAGDGRPKAQTLADVGMEGATALPVMLVQTSAYATLLWLNKVMRPGLRIVDVGGANGKSYWHYRHYFDWPDGATWTVVDRPALTAYGVELAKAENAKGLAFATDMAAVEGCDVLLSLGCIQYLPPEDLAKFHRLALHARRSSSTRSR